MDTWTLLKKELKYYGIIIVDSKKCYIQNEDGETKIQGVIKTIRILNSYVKKQKKIFLSLWNELIETVEENTDVTQEVIDDKMTTLFIYSLKDLIKYLLCFDDIENSKYQIGISSALTRDINTFNKNQVYTIPDYKISIDWIGRNINKLLYLSKLLSFAAMGRKKVSQYDIKTARGIMGPWSRLDLPMLERVFPFGSGLKHRERGKQNQRRYTKGLQEYNNSGEVGEGHFWRELRNEPFLWANRSFDDPYPSRSMLSGKA